MSRIAITVNGQTLVGNTHQPLLEQLEQAGLQPEFQCRNGVCGACRCKLDKGNVAQEDAMAYLAAGEILTCRSDILRSDGIHNTCCVSLGVHRTFQAQERSIEIHHRKKIYFKREKKGKKTETENASLENEYQHKYGSSSLKHWLTYYQN